MLTSFARRCIAAVLALGGAVALPLATAAPAHADQVRQKQQWVLDALDVRAAWHVTRGRNVTVAVIDSGVDPRVSDLSGSVTTGPDLTGVRTPVSNANWGDHGTWMASLIAGHGHGHRGQNGILGVAPRSRILSIRVITDRSDPGYPKYRRESTSRSQHQLAAAIRYSVTHGAAVISMSLGYHMASLIVRSALQYALRHNVVVVASSGNSGTPRTAQGKGNAPYSFPADYPGVIGVAAVSQSRQPAYFSSENLSVEVAAPGVNVPAQGRGSKYWLVSGTSPACALTAGVAALIKSRYPHLTASQIRRAITGSTANRPRHGYDDQIGFGTVDAAAALRQAGRLARQVPANRSAAAKSAAAGRFGNGLAGVPPLPVPPRGRHKLLLLLAIAAACLLICILSMWRFAVSLGYRGATRRVAGSGRSPASAPAAAGSAQGAAVNVMYPSPIGLAQGPNPPPGAAQPAPGYPGPGYPGPGYPGWGYAGQGFAGQGPAGEGPAGAGPAGAGPVSQGLVGHGPADQGQAGQNSVGSGFAGPGFAGPGFAGPGLGGPGVAGPDYAGPDYAGPDYAGPGQPFPGQPFPGQPVRQAPAQQAPPLAGHPVQSAGQSFPAGSFPAGSGPSESLPGQPLSGQPFPAGSFPMRSLSGQIPPGESPPDEDARGLVAHGQVQQTQPGRAQPGQAQPGQTQPGQTQPGQVRPEQAQPAQDQPAQDQPAQDQPAQLPGSAGSARAGPAGAGSAGSAEFR